MGKRSKYEYAIAENRTFVLLSVVRHISDQLYSMAFEIIIPLYELYSEEPKQYEKPDEKFVSFTDPPSQQSQFFSMSLETFCRKLVSFVSGMRHVTLTMTKSRLTIVVSQEPQRWLSRDFGG